MGRTRFVALAVVAGALVPASAGAVIPSGNQLVNGNAETGPFALNSTDSFTPQGWSAPGAPGATRPTQVGYAAPGFFTDAERARIGGGRAFFAGGPGGGGLNEPKGRMIQFVDVSAAAAEIDAGQVKLTIGGCLGGYADQADYAVLSALLPDGTVVATVTGPGPAVRENATTLLPRAATGAVPTGTRSLRLQLLAVKATGAGTYNDGYADNLSATLQPAGGVPPAPNCKPTTPGGGSGGAGGGGGAGDSSLLVPVGAARFVGRSVRVKLRCVRHEGDCAGRAGLSIRRLPKLVTSSAVSLGRKRFTIPAGRTKVVKVGIGRKARKRFRATSRRRLRKVRLSLRLVTESGTARFRVRLKR